MSRELIERRIEKAESTFMEDLRLFEMGYYNGAVNRFYYAAFHGMRAVLATKELDSSKHSGVISLFNRYFIKPGLISKRASKTVTKVFSERSHADYDDFKVFHQAEVEKLKEDVREFLEEVKDVISEQI